MRLDIHAGVLAFWPEHEEPRQSLPCVVEQWEQWPEQPPGIQEAPGHCDWLS